jgi:hypothetical protein
VLAEMRNEPDGPGGADGSGGPGLDLAGIDDAAGDDLPTRSAPQRTVVYRIRRMDDPEILERVLAGLLSLS